MAQGVNVASIYVRDQEEALQFYVGKLGFKVHTDVKNGDYRWLTVQHPDQPSFQLGLSKAMAPMVMAVDDCRKAYDRLQAAGVEFTQEPVERYGAVDASFRDPSGNGWKMIEGR